jgi:hypothetical protein
MFRSCGKHGSVFLKSQQEGLMASSHPENARDNEKHAIEDPEHVRQDWSHI